ncbi:hypothetical protein HHK36_031056 [Tetracentron sinense]|uniref:Uncharacterized protein n=1 Tax=Tetracentron sinense TaxID=13715 RepID=A0A834YCU2_TETSI|nr:hypothetical protein HHK36_031056 [Tetracentron sinense]
MDNNPQSYGALPLRPPIVGSMGPQSFGPPMSMQFRPMVPVQQAQPFIPAASQQFRPVGQGISTSNVGMPPAQSQQLQFSQPMQQLPPRPGQPGQGPPSSQPILMPYYQPNRPITSGSQHPRQNSQHLNNHMPGIGGPGLPLSSSYTFAPSSYGQPQNSITVLSQYQSPSQMHVSVMPTGGQPWLSSGGQTATPVTPVQQTSEQAVVTISTVPATNVQPNPSQQSSDWQEHTSADGKRYFYNKKTRQSSWEKPSELMTPIERADASTVWKEYTTPEGRKCVILLYYFNKVTKQSKWTIPEELKLARDQAERAVSLGTQLETAITSQAPVTVATSSVDTPSNASTSVSSASSLMSSGVASSPVPVTPVVAVVNPLPVVGSGSSAVQVELSPVTTNAVGVRSPLAIVTPLSASVSGSAGIPVAMVNTITTSMSNFENILVISPHNVSSSVDGASVQDIEEAKKGMAFAGKINTTPLEEKTVDDEPFVYATKLEAKNAFKALLESSNVESDWNWEQAMRVIINDKRYGALKTLGERKQAFNEYLGQKKKHEAEERRIKQKKAREYFTKMLEESKELTSSTKWSKAVTMFEDDERFKAVRARDHEDLYENYLVELQKQERTKALEQHKQDIMEYRKFLESCDFIKANSQWRKIQDRLEDDGRCSRLEKIDRLEIFQGYIHDLEKEEEEQRKIQKEQLRRAERQNRDEFRKLMEGHVAAGTLTAKTHWRDYCMKVKDLPAYMTVSSNTSGSTPKDLFEDVAEELEKQYHEDKSRIMDAKKLGKIPMASRWTLEDFKAAILEDVSSPPISDINVKLVFDELLEKTKKEEEKEAKKRQRLADDFSDLLYSIKEIIASSKWEDCNHFLKIAKGTDPLGKRAWGRRSSRNISHTCKKRQKRRNASERKKSFGISLVDVTVGKRNDQRALSITSYGFKVDKRREKDRDRKHRKRHQSAVDDVSSDKDEKEQSKKSRRHGSDRKKSRKLILWYLGQHPHSPESDSESRRKRHKRDHWDGSRRNGIYEELEDGELGEDGEIQ